ncbi:hypothetical protein QYE76_025857 [Lolium multiflorum]|uniref:Uncharacterized protein n=1 Tax=Lolium multiflorum TaxID=4521 RepID=A0AAD8RF76_LOLMU|nr:hypothetical protein QYE76_025857 [Lolium multiflorum]
MPPSYKNFVMNYNMQNMNKELPELFGMLKTAEIEIKKEHQVLMVNKTTVSSRASLRKIQEGWQESPPMKPKDLSDLSAICKEKGQLERNCSKYTGDLKSGLVKKKKEAWRSSAGLYTATDTTPSCVSSRGATTAAPGTGRWTSSSSTTERVAGYGGAVRGAGTDRDQDLLRFCKRQVIVYRSNKSLIL